MTASSLPRTTAPRGTTTGSILRMLLLGAIPLIFTLNSVLEYLSRRTTDVAWVSASLYFLSELPEYVYKTIVPLNRFFWFELLIRWILWSLALHGLLAGLASLRHGTPRFALSSLMGFGAGLFIITWLSWLLWLVVIGYAIVAALGEFVSMIVRTVVVFLFTPPVVYVTVPLLLLLVAFFVYAIYSTTSRKPIDWRKVLIIGGAAAGVLLLALLLWPGVIQPLFAGLGRWWGEWLAPALGAIFGFIAKLVIYLIGTLVLLGVLFILGRQLAEQVCSPLTTGQRTCGFFDTGFSIGAGLALIMLVCFSNDNYTELVNQAWAMTAPIGKGMDVVGAFHWLVPPNIAEMLRGVLKYSSLPLFDSLILFFGLFLANCSILTGILAQIDLEPLRRIIARDRHPILLKSIGGVLLALAFAIADSMSTEK